MNAVLSLARPHQWSKNLLVFGALFFSGKFLLLDSLGRIAIVFVVFCLLSSATYIFNDWRDLAIDRNHPLKLHRPLAAGTVTVSTALFLMLGLYAAAIAIGLSAKLPPAMWMLLGGYVAINVAYSLGLKHVSVVELFCVAAGFVLRFYAGVLAIDVRPSPWIIAAVAMGALLVVCAKRRADITAGHDPERIRPSLEGYNLAFLDSTVTGLSFGTLVVYLLFCVSDYAETRYGQRVMLTAIPVAMGLFRFQQIVLVEGRGDAPTELLFGDAFLLLTLACFTLMFALFLYA